MFLRLKNWYNDQTLNKKVKYLFLLIIGLYVLVFVGIYMFIVQKSLVDYTKQSNLNTMTSIGNNLNAEIESIDNMSQLIMTDSDVVRFLKTDQAKEISVSRPAIQTIYEISNLFHNVSSVFIIRQDMQYIHSGIGVNQMDIDLLQNSMEELEKRAGGYVVSVNVNGAIERNIDSPVVSLMRIINDLETQKPIGVIVINLSVRMLDRTYSNMDTQDKQFFFFDKELRPLSEHEPLKVFDRLQLSDLDYEQKEVERGYILSYYKVEDTPFVLASYEKIRFGEVVTNEAWRIVLIILVVTFLAIVIIGFFITTSITHPIERLAESMSTVKTGWLRRVSLTLPNDEIGYLKDSYNMMLIEINALIDKLLEKEKSIQKAEMRVLQEQIKPHFLYNTLDTIGYVALTDTPEATYDAIDTLGKFYRQFLNQGGRDISLKDEVDIIKHYLKLQRLRYGDIFDDVYSVEPSVADIGIPKLILQPLVENALYHGIRPKGECCKIMIMAYEKEGYLYIEVEDTGVGMTKEEVANLESGEGDESFGFKGTMDRLRYYYDTEEVYDIISVIGEFTRIQLKLPLKRSNKYV